MKKKLEAELISIAHRILKLKNRAELDVLREETLKLYEKLSVLKFVEDNFSDVKPTIGYASAEAKLEEVYGIDEVPEVKANEVEAEADKARAEKKEAPGQDKENKGGEGVDTNGDGKAPVAKEEKAEAPVEAEEETEVAKTEQSADAKEAEPIKEEESAEEGTQEETATEEATKTEAEGQPKEEAQPEEPEEDKENAGGEGVDTDADGKAPIAEEEKAAQEVAQKDEEAESAKEVQPAKIIVDAEVGLHPEEQIALTPEPELPATGTLSETEGQDKDNGAGEGVESPGGKPAVSAEEKKNTEDSGAFDFGFAKKDEPAKQKEISFEDFHDYKEPEFVKKGSTETPAQPKAEETDDWRNWQPNKTAETPAPPKEEPKAEEPKYDPISDWRNWEPNKDATKQPEPEQPKTEPAVDDWMNWEPSKSAAATTPEVPKEEPKAEPVTDDWRNWAPTKPAEEPKTEAPKQEAPKFEIPKPEPVKATPKFNDGFVRAMSLGLNDRIAFEKNLFGGSSEDLNRVVSQLNTLNTFEEAKDFIADLVKPDYNNWNGKEEFEERFMQLVEKKFS